MIYTLTDLTIARNTFEKQINEFKRQLNLTQDVVKRKELNEALTGVRSMASVADKRMFEMSNELVIHIVNEDIRKKQEGQEDRKPASTIITATS